ncbi:MAG: helix-turn-helix transcriptional regulator [Rhodoferax sp.]|nr:helix-turn-helix transcriptional regulator [Rhodoferax sp.]
MNPAPTHPTYEPKLASVAAVIADATRSRMLSYLLAGDYASAGELARAASVSPATASGHLGKLMAAELLVCEQRGRHRYYRLADDEVAHALEALALMAERRTHTAAWANPTRQRLRFARCCYGHLAGQLGVELFRNCCPRNGWPRRAMATCSPRRARRAWAHWALRWMAWTRPRPPPAWPTAAWTGPNAATTWRASCPKHC